MCSVANERESEQAQSFFHIGMCARVLIYLKRCTMYSLYKYIYICITRYVFNPAHICPSFSFSFSFGCVHFFPCSTGVRFDEASVVYSLDTCSFISHTLLSDAYTCLYLEREEMMTALPECQILKAQHHCFAFALCVRFARTVYKGSL